MRKTNKPDGGCYLYCIENRINGKLYIGITADLADRWKHHLMVARGGPETQSSSYSYIHKAINKYGEENFTFIPCSFFKSTPEAKQAERFWIAELKEYGIGLYNLTEGGDGICGYTYTEEELQAMSDRMKGKCI